MSDRRIPLEVVEDELKRRGWKLTKPQVEVFSKAFILGFTLGRDERSVMANEEKLREHVRRMFGVRPGTIPAGDEVPLPPG